MQKGGAVYYVLKDHLGSTRVLVDEDGTVAAYYDYAPFGNLMRFDETAEIIYRFTGQEFDSESGLHNYRARLYDSDLGRFYAMDAAGQTPSPYLYAGNNPVIYVDEDGRLFGIDDLIISGVSFLFGYVSHGIQTGHWGKDALASGFISASSAWLAYNTGGAAAGLFFREGTAAFSIASATIGGAVGGAVNSAASQYYFTGQIYGKQVWRSSLAGAAGGLAGGLSGQYLTSDPIFPGVIGGAVGGGVEGSYRGQFLQGAFWGAYSSVYSSALTYKAYEAYARYLTNKALGKGAYGTDYEGTPVGVERQINEWRRQGIDAEFVEDIYDCLAFCKDFYELIGDGTPISFLGGKHLGIRLGRNFYGQTMILSKLGFNHPILLTTGAYLRGFYGNYRIVSWQYLMDLPYAWPDQIRFR